MYLGTTKPNHTDTQTNVQGVDICVHTVMDEFIAWYSEFGSIKFEDYHPMFGSARVNSMSHQIPEYQDGNTNWDVAFACVFDY